MQGRSVPDTTQHDAIQLCVVMHQAVVQLQPDHADGDMRKEQVLEAFNQQFGQ